MSFGPKELQTFLTEVYAGGSDSELIGLLAGADSSTIRQSQHSAFRAVCENGRTVVATHIASTFSYTHDEAFSDSSYGFRWACANGHLATAQWMATTFSATSTDARASGNFALIYASANGHLTVLQWLVPTFLDGTDARTDNCAAFRYSCANGKWPTAEYLGNTFSFDADDLRLLSNFAFKKACDAGLLAGVQWMLSHGLNETDVHADDDEALKRAAVTGRFNILNHFLANFTFSQSTIHAAAEAARAASRFDVADYLEPPASKSRRIN